MLVKVGKYNRFPLLAVTMTTLTFVGTINETLECRPPFPLDIDDMNVALVHFSPATDRYLVLANFVEGSVLKDGTERILGVSKFTGPPVYRKLLPTGNIFKLNVVDTKLNPINKKTAVLAVVHLVNK